MGLPNEKRTDSLIEQWPRVRAILDDALELPEDARREFVEAQCSETSVRELVLSILLAYDDDAPLLDPPTFAISQLERGEVVGAYRIVEVLGHGGMGTVYRAERDDRSYDRQVAIKVLSAVGRSDELSVRFRRERQILADLEHPNIARLLDGGTTNDGSPYLVMEVIDGLPIDTYCQERQLVLEDRLRLFAQVCAAVQFAHQSLIVHRDLKPSNLLVTADGTPKLLDFGIAKILAPADFAHTVAQTQTGWAPMTLRYASPEQVRGRNITTASDVYSLGVLLYELVVGAGPYRFDEGDLNALLAAISEQEVAPPSQVLAARSPSRRRRGLLSDVDAIVLKAMAKEPVRRYPTAAQLGEDLERIFNRQPVRARRPTLAYRAGKMLRRHRLAIAAAATVFSILTGSLIVLTLQQGRLIGERDTALRQQLRANEITGLLTETFELPDPSRSLGETITVKELLNKSRDTLLASEINEPLVAAALLGTLGETYQNLGLLEEARESLTRSIDLYRRHPARPVADLSRRLLQLARVAAAQGRYRESLHEAREALAWVTSPAVDSTLGSALLRVQSAGFVAHVETLLGRLDEARSLFVDTIEQARQIADDEVLARTLEYAAEFHVVTGEWTEAEALYREALDLRRTSQGAEHPDVALLESSLAMVISRLRPEQAEVLFRDAIDRQRAILGEQHPILATALNNFAFWLAGEGRDEEAEALYSESLAIKRAVYGDSHPKIAATLQNLGSRAGQRGELVRAERLIDQALDLYQTELGDGHPDVALCLANKGKIQLLGQQLEAAEATLRRSLAVFDASLGANHGRSAPVLLNLGETLRLRGDLAAARTYLERAVDAASRGGGSDRLAVTARFNLATAAFQLDDFEAAAVLFEAVSDDSALGLYARTRLAATRLELGQLEAAERLGREALASWRRRADAPITWLLLALRSQALALLRSGEIDLAAPLLEERMTELEKRFADQPTWLETARGDLDELAAARRARQQDSR